MAHREEHRGRAPTLGATHLLFGLFSLGYAILPTLVTIAAIVDVIRVGADWYWIPVILIFPLFGAVAYFVARGSGVRGGHVSFTAMTIKQARRALRDRQAQLLHWRGAGPLVEAGEALLTLGRYREAEAYLREAIDKRAPVGETHLPLALALESQSRYADAVPMLEELCAKDRDHKFGQAQLCLARCLDESGRRDEAKRVLLELTERRSTIEARVRLARILVLEGHAPEATTMMNQLRAEVATLPRYLRRQNGRWIRAARRVGRGATRLPRPGKAGVADSRRRALLALAVAAALIVAALLGLYVLGSGTLLVPEPGLEQRSRNLLDRKARGALGSLADVAGEAPWRRPLAERERRGVRWGVGSPRRSLD